MKRAHFKLRRLARIALGIIGAAAIVLAAIGTVAPAFADTPTPTPTPTSSPTPSPTFSPTPSPTPGPIYWGGGACGTPWVRHTSGGWADYRNTCAYDTSQIAGFYVVVASVGGATSGLAPQGDEFIGACGSCAWGPGAPWEAVPGDWCYYDSGSANIADVCNAGMAEAGGSSYSAAHIPLNVGSFDFVIRLSPWGGSSTANTAVITAMFPIYYGVAPTATPTPTATATSADSGTQTAAVPTQTAAAQTQNAGATQTAAAGGTQTAAWATSTAQGTPAPTPTPGGIVCENDGYPNCVRNGNFEKTLTGSWDTLFPGGGEQVDQNVFTQANGGPAYCGTQYMNINGNGVTQRVLLPQGMLYLNLRIRTKLDPAPYFVYPQVEIVQAGSVSGAAGTSWTVVDGKAGETVGRGLPGDNGWQTIQQSHPFLIPQAEYFDIHLYNVAYYPGAWYYPYGGGAAVWLPPTWNLQTGPNLDYQVDDFFISTSGFQTFCGIPGGPTATPNSTGTATQTPTISPTPTATTIGAATATATGTSSPAPATNFSNCDFEQGMAGWVGNNASILLAGGPIGPQFLRVSGSGGYAQQPFTWPGGPAYFTFWTGPGSGGSIHVVNDGGMDDVLWSHSESSPAWQLTRVTLPSLTAGDYRLQIRGNDFVPMDVDGVLPASNGYAYCGSGGTEVTPTSGPTSYVTPTPTDTAPFPSSTAVTLTPHATVPTNTPNATWTASPTYSPTPTRTPNVAATQTTAPQQTATQAYYASATAAQSTATALGTPAPTLDVTATAQQAASQTQGANATATSEGAPPSPSPSPMPNPPQNVEPAPGADCQRPDNPLNLAWWVDYEVCRTLTWFVWTPENTQQVISIQQQLTAYEPIGTLSELNIARDQLQAQINTYDWAHTGIDTGLNTDLTIFFPLTTPNGLLTGNLNLAPGNDTFQFVTTCSIHLADSFGDAMSKGFCASINWLQVTGILGWMQFFFDLVVWYGFIRYAWHFITNIVPNLL